MLTEGSTTYLYGRGMQNGFGPVLQETGGVRTYCVPTPWGKHAPRGRRGGGNSSYDAFGAPRAASGTQSRFRFAGQEDHSDLGLVHMRARWYDPSSGRFISRDPVVGSPESPRWITSSAQ